METVARWVFAASALYLTIRLLALWIRVRRARQAYPRTLPLPGVMDDRGFGALLGGAVGDCVGLPAENVPRWLVRLRYPSGPALRRGLVRFFRRAGDVSDDTQLTIVVARSILPDGQYSHAHFRAELRAWYAFRVTAGRATSEAALRLWRDRDAPARPSSSQGNGVCIRIAPLALARRNDASDDQLLTDVETNGRETHAGEVAIAGAKLVALLLKRSLRLPVGALQPGFDERVLELANVSGFPVAVYQRATACGSLPEQLRVCGTSGHAEQSVTAALLIVRAHPRDFSAAMRAAFDAGGDVDSVGALAGAILGANLGIGAIPAAWRAVQAREYLQVLSERLGGQAVAVGPRDAAPRPDGPAQTTALG